MEVEAVNAETCARESDVLCTCTTAHEPLFDGRLLRPGTHLNLVGTFQNRTREVDDETGGCTSTVPSAFAPNGS